MAHDNDECKHFDVPADKVEKMHAMRKLFHSDYSKMTVYAGNTVIGRGAAIITIEADGEWKQEFQRYEVCPTSLLSAVAHAEAVLNGLQDLCKLLDVKHDEWSGNKSQSGS